MEDIYDMVSEIWSVDVMDVHLAIHLYTCVTKTLYNNGHSWHSCYSYRHSLLPLHATFSGCNLC